MNKLFCFDTDASFLGIFNFEIAPQFLFYAYIPVIFLCLLLGFFIYTRKTTFSLPNKLFLGLTIIYSFHLINEIVQWVAVPASVIFFSWSVIVIFYFFITALIVLFTISYVTKKNILTSIQYLFLLSFIPIILFLQTDLNIENLDLAQCYSEVGPLYTYLFFLMGVSVLGLFFLLYKYRTNKEKVVIIIGSISAIAILFFADRISDNFELFQFNLFGPLGLLIFFGAIGYVLSEFNAFGSKVASTKILVIGLVLLIVSEIFIVEGIAMLILVATTGIISCLGGFLLVKSVDREIKQREQIEQLVVGLERANDRLQVLDKQKSEFVSIASHQLRSPLTAIRGYVSMLTEGSFGEMPEKASDVLQRINESSKFMASSIDDFLDVSRIESGNMKYDYSDVNFKEQAEHVVDDLRRDALKRGLLLMFRSNINGSGLVHADAGKTQQILHNLINNALKYTPHGSVTVYAHDDIRHKKIHVDIIDTGLGLSPESMHKLFGKFARAKIASSANIMGTGLGLFVAREMCRAMGGDITATSEGEGLGSTFTITLPLL